MSLGLVTKEEAQEVEPTIERIAGLEELLLIVEDTAMTQQIQDEIKCLKMKCDEWFKRVSSKYGWTLEDNGEWEINVMNREVKQLV